MRQHGVEFEGVAFGGIRGKGWKTALVGPFALVAACWQSRGIIRRRAPDVVLGFGGFASVPGALAGITAAKPLVLHDANAIAGLANRMLAYAADRVLLGFPGCDARPACEQGRMGGQSGERGDQPRARAGSPVRGPHGTAVAARRRRKPRRRGDQSRAFRRRSRCCPRPTRPHVVHQSGARHVDALRAAYAEAGVVARVRAVHRRHGVALCRGRPRPLPRRRDHGGRARCGGCGRDHRSVARRHRRRAERERAVSRRRRRGAENSRAGARRPSGSPRASRRSRARACSRWPSPVASVARTDAADRVADACVALGRQR